MHFISVCRQAENKCTCQSEKTSPNHTLLVPRNPNLRYFHFLMLIVPKIATNMLSLLLQCQIITD